MIGVLTRKEDYDIQKETSGILMHRGKTLREHSKKVVIYRQGVRLQE